MLVKYNLLILMRYFFTYFFFSHVSQSHFSSFFCNTSFYGKCNDKYINGF